MAGTTIGIIVHKVVNETKLEKIRKPWTAVTGVFTTVTCAKLAVLGRYAGSIEKKGEFIGMDQLQRNLILKTNSGTVQIPTDKLLTITQDESIEIAPGSPNEEIPTGE